MLLDDVGGEAVGVGGGAEFGVGERIDLAVGLLDGLAEVGGLDDFAPAPDVVGGREDGVPELDVLLGGRSDRLAIEIGEELGVGPVEDGAAGRGGAGGTWYGR